MTQVVRERFPEFEDFRTQGSTREYMVCDPGLGLSDTRSCQLLNVTEKAGAQRVTTRP